MKKSLATLSFCLLATGVGAQESYSAKSLFFGEDDAVVADSTDKKTKEEAVTADGKNSVKKEPVQVAKKKSTSQKNIGLSYFVRLKNPDGTTRDVLSSRKFNSGEKFQLGLKVNSPAYVYVLNESPSGQVTQIYPQPGVDNFINAMGTVFLPAKGAFEFDNEPGTEQLLVYVSPTPMAHAVTERVRQTRPDLITASAVTVDPGVRCKPVVMVDNVPIPSTGVQVASADTYASKGINFTDEASSCSAQAAPEAETYASKGIAFTDDSDAGGMQAVSYVVKKTTSPNENLFLKIKLHHQ